MAHYRQTGIKPQMLIDAPALPDGCAQLWSDFTELHGSRASTGFGPARITYADIDAWQRVNRVTLAPWHIEAIRKADNAYLADHAARQPKGGNA